MSSKLKFNKITYGFVLLLLFFSLWGFGRALESSFYQGVLPAIKLFRQISLPFLYSLFVFTYIKGFDVEQKLRIFNFIIAIISFDAIYSTILYYGIYFPFPTSVYPWAMINVDKSDGAFSANLLDIPTLFAYPYLHGEIFLFGVVSLYRLALRWSTKLFILVLIIHMVFQVYTAILGILIVFFLYFSIRSRVLLFIFIGTSASTIFIFRQKIQGMLIFYDYFSSEIFIKILGVDAIFLYFRNISIYKLLFGSLTPEILSQYANEIGYIQSIQYYGIIWFLIYMTINLSVVVISFKRYLKSKDKKYLLYSLVPIYVLIDAIHYINFFKIQIALICIVIYMLIVDDTVLHKKKVNDL